MSWRARAATAEPVETDIVLIGGGIMSATLGSMLAVLQPSLRITILERGHGLATESSGPWNNAGTGHSGYCELNYMPDPADGGKAAQIARQFHQTRQWWAHLAQAGLIDPTKFITRTPHMDLVFGERDVTYLRERARTLSADPLFEGLEYSEDHDVIESWAPLMMRGRDRGQLVAATRHPEGTDVDFGALTSALIGLITQRGGSLELGHQVRRLDRRPEGGWTVSGRTDDGTPFAYRAPRVFVGAGGMALRLLQNSGIPEVDGYAVLPVGAAFYRCDDPEVVAQHAAKVYGQAGIGAPPMSVPHLDKRVVDGTDHVLFGPYATFGTKLLKNGSLTDFFTTVRLRNLPVVTAASLQNVALAKYVVKELLAGRKKKFRELQRYYPQAKIEQWELVHAGKRAQLVIPDKRRVGVLQQGTELITGAEGTMSGLLGASPGASTAVPIMVDLLRQCFPQEWSAGWSTRLAEAIPGLEWTGWDRDRVQATTASTDAALGLAHDHAEPLHLVPNAPDAAPDVTTREQHPASA